MPELLHPVPVRRDRVGRCPLLRGHGRRLKLQITVDRVAIFITVPGPIAQGERRMRIQRREIHDQSVETAEIVERDQVDRIADPDHGAAVVLDRGLLPLQHDLLGQPVNRQGDRVLDALASDRVLDPIPAESEGQAQDRHPVAAGEDIALRRPTLACVVDCRSYKLSDVPSRAHARVVV